MALPGESLLHNKKIFNTLKEAIDSPVGSTKRKAAKQLVNIMNKAMSKYGGIHGGQGGQGGPGYWGQGGPGNAKYSPTSIGSASFSAKAPRKDPDYSNMVIFPSPPGPKRGKPMTHAMTPAGQTGQSQQQNETQQLGQMQQNQDMLNQPQQAQQTQAPASNFNQYQSAPDVTGAFSNVAGPQSSGSVPSTGTDPLGLGQLNQSVSSGLQGLTSPASGAPSGQGGPGDPTSSDAQTGWTPTQASSALSVGSPFTMPSSVSGLGSASVAPYSTAPTPPSTSPQLAGVPSGMTAATLSSQFPNLGNAVVPQMPGLFSPIKQVQPPTISPTSAGSTPTNPPMGSAAGTPAGGTTTTGGNPAGSSQPTGSTGGAAGSSYTMSSSDQTSTGAPTGGSTAPTAGTPASLQSAVDSNMGATGFATYAMNNPSVAASVLGIDPSQVPSGSMSSAITSLQQSMINPETGNPFIQDIGSMQKQLTQMTADGAILGPTLQKYIQYKDVSLNAIHNAQLSADNQMLHSDQGNPYEQSMWSRYSDYLNNLYTAQNASYADFFNQSTTLYTNALTALGNTLNSTITNYNNLLTPALQGTEADYTNIRQSLTDAYTAAQQAPMQQIQLQTLQNQLALSNAQLIQSGLQSQTGGDWTAVYKKYVDAGIYFTNTKPTTSKSGDVGELSPSVTDLVPMINDLASQSATASGGAIGLAGAINIVGAAMNKSLAAVGSNPDSALPAASRYLAMIESAASTPDPNTGQPVLSQAQAMDMEQLIGTTVAKSVYNHLYSAGSSTSSAVDNTGPAKAALLDAWVGTKGWFGLGAAQVPTQTQFQQKYSGTLGSALAGEIWNAISSQKQAMAAQFQSSPGIYGQGVTLDQVYEQQAQLISQMKNPSDVADSIGQTIASAFGVSNADLTSPMDPNPNAPVPADTMDTTGGDSFTDASPTDYSGDMSSNTGG